MIEIKTLKQNLDHADNVLSGDTTLKNHLNEGWQIINIKVIVIPPREILRIITLQRGAYDSAEA